MVNEYQTYCIPNRTIMDNLFLVRDIIDIANLNGENLGILQLIKKKHLTELVIFICLNT